MKSRFTLLSLFVALGLSGARGATAVEYAAPLGVAVTGFLVLAGRAGNIQRVNNWPAGQGPANAGDTLPSTSYRNFAQTNTGLIATPIGMTAVSPVNEIRLWTGSGVEGADPSSYSLYGSMTELTNDTPDTEYDTRAMTLISSGPLSLPSARSAGPTSVIFPNSTAYESYVLIFPTVKSPVYDDTNDSMQIGELQLFADTIPEPTIFSLCLSSVGVILLRRVRTRS